MGARFPSFVHDRSGTAAAELALSLPLLLTILFGATEAGHYFLTEQKLVESVRDGARYASRQSFADFPCDGAIDEDTEDAIQNVVVTGSLGGTDARLPLITADDVTITYDCVPEVEAKPGEANMIPVGGIYTASGEATVITIDASVEYQSLFGFQYGFPSSGIHVNAEQQTTLNGI